MDDLAEPTVVYGKAQLLAAILAVGDHPEVIELRRKRDDRLITTYRMQSERYFYWGPQKQQWHKLSNHEQHARQLRRIPAYVFTGEEKP